jgi:heparin/heparan-sulfate lyase
MIARTGWDWLNEESNDVVMTMEMGGCDFKGHTNPGHFGGFQIYYKGALAISSGCYQNESAHDDNYHEKSQSHNVLLVLDPEENTTYGTGGIYTANDGGQICQPIYGTYGSKPVDYADLLSTFRKAYVIAHQYGPDPNTPEYSYISGDLTPAYSNKPRPKVQDVKRSMVMLNHFDDTYPATLIIFDRIVSTNSSFKKTWQIHSIEEPQINSNTITIRRTALHYENGPSGGIGNYSGKLVIQKLLPTKATVEKIGGTGFDSWVDFEKENYPPDPEGENYDVENGMWRVEVSPSYARYEDLFLNVLTVMDNSTNNHPVAELIYNDFLIGANLLERLIFFSRTGTELGDPIDLTIPGSDNVKVLVCDLEPGFWTIRDDEKMVISTSLASEDGRCIYFSAPSGSYRLTRENTGFKNDITYKKSFCLLKNYPNPFNSSTRIQFSLPYKANVLLEIYNSTGQLVEILVNENMGVGSYNINWDASDMPSGIYFYKIRAGSFVDLKKMILLR